VTKSKQHFGELVLMGRMICINGGFLPFGLEKRPCRILKNNILNVIRFLVWPNVNDIMTLMTSLFLA
jgi:hypothetical protein